jgi:hypothetical protein
MQFVIFKLKNKARNGTLDNRPYYKKEVIMPAYAYPITVNYSKQKITTSHKKILDDCNLTIDTLKNIVGNNSFSFGTEDEHFWTNTCIYWTTERDETDQEQAQRISKEESYMVEYNKRKGK